jgi:hypothetical protein
MAQLEEPKLALTRELDRSRSDLGLHAAQARILANPEPKLRASFSRHRVAWIGAAAVLGLLLAKIPARTKKVKASRKSDPLIADNAKAGLALGAFKIAFDLAKPFLMAWATTRLGDLAQKSQRNRSSPKF